MGVMNLKLAAEISTEFDDKSSSPTDSSVCKLPGNPYYRQHSRNRSLDSAQVLSCFHHGQAGSELGSPVQLPHDTLSSKSNSPSVLVNDRILSMRQQHCCLYHDFRTVSGESHHHDLPPTTGKLKCTCAASSDDSGICSGASGTTGSETDDLNCSVACDTYDDDDDEMAEKAVDSSADSPRLSFDSAVLTDDHDDHEDVDVEEHDDSEDALETSLDTVVLSKCLGVRRLSASCDETVMLQPQEMCGGGDVEGDLDLTLINDEIGTPCAATGGEAVPISTLLESSGCSVTTTTSFGEMDQQVQELVKDVGVIGIGAGDTGVTLSESVVDAPGNSTSSSVNVVGNIPTSTSSGSSLLSRIRVNARGGNKSNNSSTQGTSGNNASTASVIGTPAAAASTTIAAGMRSKLRLNFGKGKDKTKQQGGSGALSTTPVVAESTETPKTPTGTGAYANEVVSGTSANNCTSSAAVGGEEDKKCSDEISDSNHCTTVEQNTCTQVSQLSKPKSWLLRFFESQVFNMSYAIGYLFTSKEPGVQQYIGIFC